MGQDGQPTAANRHVARDAYGFNLNYFTGDYSSIAGVQPFSFDASGMSSTSPYRPLYNGNISSMAVNIGQFSQPQLYNYGYDQLNRLVKMDVYRGLNNLTNSWNPLTLSADYQERVSYDGNGNIQTYNRQAYGSSLDMDQLTYNYYAGTNQLNHIMDGKGYTHGQWGDIGTQGADNYQYDSTGNLLKDNAANIGGISWNVYGKIKSLWRYSSAGEVSSTDYSYDPNGNRVGKVYTENSGTQRKQWFVRDAQGNVMAVYNMHLNSDWSNGALKLVEQDLYGSSRLGMVTRDQNMDSDKVYPVSQNLIGNTWLYQSSRGLKQYELSNHLGNVLVTISDKKYGMDSTGDGVVDYYLTDVLTASDYYPFGMDMPGRHYPAKTMSPLTEGAYRYGFNGKMKDFESYGDGNEYDYGMRIYNPTIGRFLSKDPLSKSYPWNSPYSYAEGDVIRSIDMDGLEKVFVLYNPFGNPWVICFGCGIKEASDNYMSGIVQKDMVENGQMPYQNKKVPQDVQDRLNKINISEANAKIATGISQTTLINVQTSLDVASTLVPLSEEVNLASKGLFNLLKSSEEAKSFAIKYAEEVLKNTSKDELPRAITAILDTKTGKVYYGRSGILKGATEINPELKKLLPSKSLEKWPVSNCAECDALNNALNSGADIKNLEMHTLKIDKKTGIFEDFERCANCKITTKDIKTTSDKKK